MDKQAIRDFINKTNIYSLDDLKRDYYRKTSGHWFDKDAMRFFRSRLSNDLFYSPSESSIYFVSSEQFDYNSPRLYTIRKYNVESGDMDTVGEFQQYKSGQTAKNNIKRMLGL